MFPSPISRAEYLASTSPGRGVVYVITMPAMPVEKADEMRRVIYDVLAREAYTLNLTVEVAAVNDIVEGPPKAT